MTIFNIKKWLWRQYTKLMGADKAYAKYLAHFNHYQNNIVDRELQKDLDVKPMTKDAFIKVWRSDKKCKPGCCS